MKLDDLTNTKTNRQDFGAGACNCVEAIAATSYAMAVLAGYAAGILLLLWRCGQYSKLDAASREVEAAIRRGDFGIEQTSQLYSPISMHASMQFSDRFGLVNLYPELWNPSGWFVLVAGIWFGVFLSLGLLCRTSTWLAPYAIRMAIRGPSGARAKEIWRNTLRKTISRIRSPLVLAAAFLLGLAIVVFGDIVSLLVDMTPRGDRILFGFVVQSELPFIFCVVFIIPIAFVRIVAGRQVGHNCALARRWCVRCGTLLGDPAESHVATCCPECGYVGLQLLDKPHTGLLQVPLAIALFGGLALLLAAHQLTTVIPDIYKSIFPDPGVVGDGAVVRIGSVVRMRRPEGNIWFRVDRLNPSDSGGWGGALSSHDVLLRVITEIQDPSGSDANYEMKRKLVKVRVNDPTPENNISKIWWTPIGNDGNSDRIRITADWNADDGTVAISLFPPGATSVQAVDPAIAPPFD